MNRLQAFALAVLCLLPPFADGHATTTERILFKLVDPSTGQTHEVTRKVAEEVGLTTIETKSSSFGTESYVFTGVLIGDILRHFNIDPTDILADAHNDYKMTIPSRDYLNYPVLIAFELDNEALTRRQKGPSVIIYPISLHPELEQSTYEAREVWHLRSLTALDE